METLWAPWRMEYILAPKGAGGCIFCAFPSRDTHREDLVLAVRERAFVCLNRYPFTAGHLLVVPRTHVADLSSLENAEYADFCGLLRDAASVLRAHIKCDGMNIGMNLARAAGAGIDDHLHAHVVPRFGGDTNFMPVIADVRVMPEYLDETWKRLRPHFESLEEK